MASSKQVWVDGGTGRELDALRSRSARAMRRCGSGRRARTDWPTALLDADIAMPAIYGRALSAEEIEARFARQGLSRPTRRRSAGAAGRSMRSEAIGPPTRRLIGRHAHDHQPRDLDDRRARAFDADVPRFGSLRPRQGPPPRPRLAAGFRRSLRLPLEGLARISAARRRSFRASTPAGFASRSTVKKRLYHTVFIVKKAAARPKAPIAFLCSTNTWRAYAATPFCPTWSGLKKSIGNNGFANSPGDPPAFCFYRPHHAGQGTYFRRVPDALADRRALHADGPRRMGLQPPLPAGSVHADLAGDAGLLITTS